MAMKNHYEELEISRDAKLIDVKKAYRRLALRHHPDRNGGSAESTEKFKDISAAFTILSDTKRRSDYDLTLRDPSTSTSPATRTPTSSPSRSSNTPPRQGPPTPTSAAEGVQDAFQQFDDLFRNDPFFHGAFQDMDDVFTQRFDRSQDQKRDDSDTSDPNTAQWDSVGSFFMCGMNGSSMEKPKATNQVPWSEWLMNKIGIEVSVTSISHKADGSVEASAYTSKPFGTYSKKKTRTYVQNGQQVSVMSMEKDGNRIEDKFIAGEMVERKVNGKIEQMPKQVAN